MPEMLSPGVFAREVSYEDTVQASSTSVLGIVGVFEKGPVRVATLVTSLEDAKRKFGTYLDAQGHFGLLALHQFFENGGSRARVVRTVKYTAGSKTSAIATIALVDRAGSPLPTLRVDASSDGAWGNDLNAEVQASAAYPTNGFNLIVKTDVGTVLETYKDLLIGTTNQASADYVERRINGVSSYIKVTDLLSATAAQNNRPATTPNAALAGGIDGLTSLADVDYTDALTALNAYDDISLVAIPGEGTPAVALGLVSYVEARKDCLALIETVDTDDTATELVAFRKGATPYSHGVIDSSYAALYGPWLGDKHPVTGRDIKVPPAGIVAGVMARTDQQVAVHAAPAGFANGKVRGATALVPFSRGEMDTLYVDGVNPICQVNGVLLINGQKTLQVKGSATDRVNVRRLMLFVEKSVTNAAQQLVFERNDSTTWNRFIRAVTPFLRRIKSEGGLQDFAVICDATLNDPSSIDANIMKAMVLVKPSRSAEFLSVEFAIAGTGANLSDL